jgi:hypothetical protein
MKALSIIFLSLLLAGCYTSGVFEEDHTSTTVVIAPAHSMLPQWYGWYNPWYPYPHYLYHGVPHRDPIVIVTPKKQTPNIQPKTFTAPRNNDGARPKPSGPPRGGNRR